MGDTCPLCKKPIPPDGECTTHSCRYLRALSHGELIAGATPDIGKLVVQTKYGRLFEQPDTSFFAKDAGRLAGTTKRNVQYWTDQDLVVPDVEGNPGKGKTGQGRARKYSLLNCVELAIISRLAEDGLGQAVIKMAMLAIGGWRHHVFGVDDAYLLIYRDKDAFKVQVYWNLTSWDKVLGQEEPQNYDKIFIVNLAKIRNEVLARVG